MATGPPEKYRCTFTCPVIVVLLFGKAATEAEPLASDFKVNIPSVHVSFVPAVFNCSTPRLDIEKAPTPVMEGAPVAPPVNTRLLNEVELPVLPVNMAEGAVKVVVLVGVPVVGSLAKVAWVKVPELS